MRRAPLLLLPLSLALAACGGTTASQPLVASKAQPSLAMLEIVQKVDTTKGLYIEGFVWNLAVRRPGGRTVYSQQVRKPTVKVRLLPGSYHVDSNVQPCDGNCGYLDGPTDACGTDVVLAAGEHRRIVVKMGAGSPCEFKT